MGRERQGGRGSATPGCGGASEAAARQQQGGAKAAEEAARRVGEGGAGRGAAAQYALSGIDEKSNGISELTAAIEKVAELAWLSP